MEKNGQSIKNLMSCLAFVMLMVTCTLHLTYVTRDIGYDRSHIVGISGEKADVLYIGGSAAFRYWQPMKAWKDYGIASYLYATNSLPAESIRWYLEEALTTQDPELVVIDARVFQYWDESFYDAAVRKGSDSMPFLSVNRFRLISTYLNNRQAPDEDPLSYYLDFIKYHGNTSNFGTEEAWGFIENEGVSKYKGWEWKDEYVCLNEPDGFITDEAAELPAQETAILKDLLEYCKKKDLEVLFVVTPYHTYEEHEKKFNSVEKMVREYGFQFINGNRLYKEIGIDFSTDFYDLKHVNLFGAEKFTGYLESFIHSEYQVPDRTNDINYQDWEKLYLEYEAESVEHKKTVSQLIRNEELDKNEEEKLRSMNNLSDWMKTSLSYPLALFCVLPNTADYEQNETVKYALKDIEEMNINSREIFLIRDHEIADAADGESHVLQGQFNDSVPIEYEINLESSQMRIKNKTYELNQDALYFAAVNTTYQEIIDVIKVDLTNNQVFVEHMTSD